MSEDTSGEIVEAEIVPDIAEPEILHKGKYTLYKKPDGGLHLAYQREDSENTDHIELPAAMIRLFDRAQNEQMNPLQLAREFMRMGRG
jgi:hypothetical protein